MISLDKPFTITKIEQIPEHLCCPSLGVNLRGQHLKDLLQPPLSGLLRLHLFRLAVDLLPGIIG